MTTTEIVLSIITILISAAAFIYSLVNSDKINRINLRINYFDIFKDDLTKLIPEFYTSFITNESYIVNDSIGLEFEEYINKFRKKIKFLKFVDKKGYTKLDANLIKLEEEIIILPTRKENREEHILLIDNIIKKIYKTLNKHFT